MSKEKSQLKFLKLNPKAKIPTQGTESAAGYDLYLAEKIDRDFDGLKVRIAHFGVAVEIPEGYCGLLVSRSSLQRKGFQQANGVGIIDSDYRGELMAPYVGPSNSSIEAGERIAQLVIVPYFNGTSTEVDSLNKTERGDGGFGSTGTA